METNTNQTEAADIDVMTVLISAFPRMWGQDGIEIKHVDGPTWPITIPTDAWRSIESEGHFEFAARLSDGAHGKIEIEIEIEWTVGFHRPRWVSPFETRRERLVPSLRRRPDQRCDTQLPGPASAR